MRRYLQIALPVLAICLLASDAAFAQGQRGRGRGGFPGGGGAGFLLMNPQVQKELKMTDDQTAKVGEIVRESFQGGAGGGFQNFQNLSEEERTKLFEDMRKRAEESNKKIMAELSDDQKGRLKQIQLWIGGISGLAANEEASKELKITDDQKEALKTIAEESGNKTRELFQGYQQMTPDEQAKAREKMTAARKEMETECEAVLTDEQKAKFAKMKGEKFELDMSQLGNRGRRGRPGNNNN